MKYAIFFRRNLESALFNDRKLRKEPTESFPFSEDAVLSLLAGGKVKPKDIFVTAPMKNWNRFRST